MLISLGCADYMENEYYHTLPTLRRDLLV